MYSHNYYLYLVATVGKTLMYVYSLRDHMHNYIMFLLRLCQYSYVPKMPIIRICICF